MTDTDLLFPKIVGNIVTKDACVDLIKKLQYIKDSGYMNNSSNTVSEFLALSGEYNGILSAEFTTDSPVSSVISYITALIEYLSHLEYVEVTMAFHPSKEFLHKLYSWLQSQLTFEFYIHVLVDDSIGGGLLLSYKGIYVDLSLKKAVSDYFVTNKDYVSARI